MTPPPGLEAAFRGTLGRFVLDARFTAPARGVTALFGPSGCGKTTVLRCVAGLQRLPVGFCRVGDEVWQDGPAMRPPHRRPLGYVFQEPSLFAHLSVRRNLLFGAPRRAAPAEWDETVDLLGLRPLLDRAPARLSGGERQRVAIGRALLSRPKLLLMDEPLSALDRASRHEILSYLERLCATLAVPVLYVSHEMAEVERLAAHLVLMEGGRVTSAGPLTQLQSDPALPLAQARDAAVSLQGTVLRFDAGDGLAVLALAPGVVMLVPSPPLRPGATRRLRIAAGDVSLAREPGGRSTILNVVPARILESVASGPHEVTAVLALGVGTEVRILARVTRRSWAALDLQEGEAVFAQVKAVALEAAGLPAGDTDP